MVDDLNDPDLKVCYACDIAAFWLAPDGRCGSCTVLTPEEVTGEISFDDD